MLIFLSLQSFKFRTMKWSTFLVILVALVQEHTFFVSSQSFENGNEIVLNFTLKKTSKIVEKIR